MYIDEIEINIPPTLSSAVDLLKGSAQQTSESHVWAFDITFTSPDHENESFSVGKECDWRCKSDIYYPMTSVEEFLEEMEFANSCPDMYDHRTLPFFVIATFLRTVGGPSQPESMDLRSITFSREVTRFAVTIHSL